MTKEQDDRIAELDKQNALLMQRVENLEKDQDATKRNFWWVIRGIAAYVALQAVQIWEAWKP